AFGRLAAQSPHVRLAVVGDGPDRERLEAIAPDGVTFLGELRGESLAAAYACADVFCFPSTSDTFGQVILEAGASGVPTVAARAGGAPELVRHGTTGLLVPPDDPTALAAALHELVDDAPRRLALGRNALAAARRRSWRASFDELRLAYASVTGLRSANGSDLRP